MLNGYTGPVLVEAWNPRSWECPDTVLYFVPKWDAERTCKDQTRIEIDFPIYVEDADADGRPEIHATYVDVLAKKLNAKYLCPDDAAAHDSSLRQ